jgi:hypothetical protein
MRRGVGVGFHAGTDAFASCLEGEPGPPLLGSATVCVLGLGAGLGAVLALMR